MYVCMYVCVCVWQVTPSLYSTPRREAWDAFKSGSILAGFCFAYVCVCVCARAMKYDAKDIEYRGSVVG
jgi:hypothetical protein